VFTIRVQASIELHGSSAPETTEEAEAGGSQARATLGFWIRNGIRFLIAYVLGTATGT
jgi:hypothetical protein